MLALMSEEEHIARDRFAVARSLGNDDHSPKKETPQSKISRLLRIIGRVILATVAFSVIVVLCLRWVPPPTSAFMLEQQVDRFFQGKHQPPIRYRWVAWKAISSQMPLAIIAAEDQKFPQHWGFDVQAISEAMEKNKQGNNLRGASTITQQVAKNLFLWSGRSYVRKGLEAYLTILLELLWTKQRILEVYLNIVEFGDGIYGVSTAAETFIGKRPSELTKGDAALLAAVLPNPKQLNVRSPSPHMLERKRWIEEQMEQLGGVGYLKDL
jgi:monofunctional biosynthetic peptidoglycan transglycosylase